MSRILTPRERAALKELSVDHEQFLPVEKFVGGVSAETLDGLVTLGLAEKGISRRPGGREGWRILPDGWRCMYGKTIEEIMIADKTIVPLPVWRWPLP